MFNRKISLVIFVITILSDDLQGRPEGDWFESVKTRLSNPHQVYSAMIIRDNNTDDFDVLRDELFGKIIESMPSEIFSNLDGVHNSNNWYRNVSSRMASSLLFVYYHRYSGDNTRVHEVINTMRGLSKLSAKCYFLIVLRTSSVSKEGVEDMLRHSWNNTMLNILICEIRRDENSSVTNWKVPNDESNRVIIHLYNPFLDKFYHKKFFPKLELFPDFASNMYGKKLNVLIVQQVPLTFVKWDKNNEMTEMSGANIALMQTLAGAMNFTPVILPKWNGTGFSVKTRTFDAWKFFKTTNTDITANLEPHFTEHISEESLRFRPIMAQEVGVLMPVEYAIDKKYQDNAVESSIITLIIMMIFWFVGILLRLDKKIWNFSIIICLLFSFSVPRQPSKAYERILFLSLSMLGFMYSNQIYASLTNVAVLSLEEREFVTFEEIDASGLIPIVPIAHFERVFRNAVGAELNLKKKSQIIVNIRDCPKMAMVYRNVCCIMYNTEGEYYRRLSRQDNGQYRLKFAKPILRSDNGAFGVRDTSPYKTKINYLIQRCFEAGLISKWYLEAISPSRSGNILNDDKPSRGERSATFRRQLMVVIVFGHSLATLVFFGELLVHRLRISHSNIDKSRLNLRKLWKMKTK
ncbi:uncharacterized protein LOC114841067 [Diachasma alloeum]|uniref:Ionotropic receptor 127 n=1 Tax=Diachasma alloeum TaxID=454923 RepID=A0A4E0RJK4_9HYME|nr:uncharacterized protein LOC114841067 [Diachasma alloeum]THK32932.1 ionotropic receptor 127 [Diachasma alloeum]